MDVLLHIMRSEAKMVFMSALCIVLFGTVSSAYLQSKTSTLQASEDGSFSCTMDAKECPDGSYVGRIPPYCQFSACPGN